MLLGRNELWLLLDTLHRRKWIYSYRIEWDPNNDNHMDIYIQLTQLGRFIKFDTTMSEM